MASCGAGRFAAFPLTLCSPTVLAEDCILKLLDGCSNI